MSPLAFLLLVGVAHAGPPPADPTVVLVPFTSEESIERLSRSAEKTDFFALAMEFEPQQNRGTCGPTTAVIVLNALRRDEPGFVRIPDETAFPSEYRSRVPPGIDPTVSRYSQRTFIDARFASVKTKDAFYGVPQGPGEKPDPGLQLRQLHGILEAYGLDSQITVVDDAASVDDIRTRLRSDLAHEDGYVIVNYFRPALGQAGGGHISPLGAYDKKSDSFLLMDVNPTAQPWVWVETEDLVAAMRTADRVENRGFLQVREGTAQ